MDRESRIAELDRLVRTSDESRTYRLPWEGRYRDFPVIRVRTDTVLYRIDSGRTRRAQLKYLSDNGLPADFFRNPELEEVQQAEHSILMAMNAADKRELRRFLEEEGQMDPTVLTHDGFVVNGNRRLCVFREDRNDYMDAVVLPRCTPQEIYELELALQMAPETKSEYNWVDELLTIREGLETFGESPQKIATRMRTNSENVLHLRARLSLVDQYLEFIGAEGAYHRVPDESLQSFTDLQDGLETGKRSMSAQQLRVYRDIAFFSISGGVFYRNLRRLWKTYREDPDLFMKQFVENSEDEIPHDLTPIDTEVASSTEDELLDALTHVGQEQTQSEQRPSQEALAVLQTLQSSPHTLLSILNVTREDIDSERAQHEAASKPIEALRAAKRSIESINLKTSVANGLGLPGLRQVQGLIEDLKLRLARLSEWVSKSMSRPGR